MTAIVPFYVGANGFDPYENLALEASLMQAVRPGERILYLWQNANTIVLGKNQNAWRECLVEEFEVSGGRVARRKTGGGAVYHDKGNLNFSFIAQKECFDIEEQLRIICDAVRSFGVQAHTTGRNDIAIQDAKFSGNAFFTTQGACLHHGTLMVKVDPDRLGHFLRPDAKKLRAKGVASVRSRVINLSTLCPSITITSLEAALIEAFGQASKNKALPFDTTRLNKTYLTSQKALFASLDWRLGHRSHFTHLIDERFDWGSITLELEVKGSSVSNARVFSDALDVTFPAMLEKALLAVRYEKSHLIDACEKICIESVEQGQIKRDCIGMIERQFFDASTAKDKA